MRLKRYLQKIQKKPFPKKDCIDPRSFKNFADLFRSSNSPFSLLTDSQFSNKVRVRSCAVIVQDDSILLAKIAAPTRKKPIWMPPGGGVELGESLEMALKRELKEETGLGIEQKQLLWIHEFIEEPYHAIEFYFRCEVKGGNLEKGSDPELQTDQQMIEDLSFIPLDKAMELHIEPSFIKEFCENGGKFFENVRHITTIPS